MIGAIMTTLLLAGCGNKAAGEDTKTHVQDNDKENAPERYANGNSLGNIRNGGKILDYGEWIVYANETGIYKVKKDGSKWDKISDITNCQYINLYNEWIYVVYNDDELYRVKVDGSKSEAIRTGNGKPLPYGISVVGDVLYAGCEYFINLSDLPEEMKDKMPSLEVIYDTFTTPMHTINITNDSIFFYGKESDSKKDKAGIYRMDMDGSQAEKIYEGYVYFCVVDGEWAYCWDYANSRTKMFKFMLDGTDKQELLDYSDSDDDTYISGLNVKDGWIYYELSGDVQNGIYKMKTDGTEQQLLTNNRSYENREGIYVVDEWVYYCPTESSNELWRVKVDGTEDGLFVSFD